NHRLYERIRRQSIRDPLTDAFNRHHFEERLETEVGRSARSGRPLSLVFIDVDGFKALNDTYGHGQGDDVLRGIASLLLASTRDEDCVCRYGGDEFVVLLPEADCAAAEAKADEFREGIERMSFPNALDPDASVRVTVSCGVACSSGSSGDADLLTAADLALYRAKRTGRNRVSA
ncbi:MAG: GGDEF domain-containing protein, partial [Planctomycetes bacterium]|nr:GGDEF domain-containing protein [Planctomycetota bacterium]